jgi:uncharacterized protein with von Willebrand factor type A (vWA) domain
MLSLIKSRAGSKMLREADRMVTYDHVYDLFCEKNLEEACDELERHAEIYLEYEPKSFIDLEEIDFEEVWTLHPAYMSVLRSLTWHDPDTATTLNKKLEEMGYEVTDVENKDAFEYAYTEWFHRNEPMINRIENWALGVPEEGYSHVERARYDRMQEIFLARQEARVAEEASKYDLFLMECQGLPAAMEVGSRYE